MKTINFLKNTFFTGRNGTFQQYGIVMNKSIIGTISFHPITGKGKTGNCLISIPVDKIDDFCNALQALKTNH